MPRFTSRSGRSQQCGLLVIVVAAGATICAPWGVSWVSAGNSLRAASQGGSVKRLAELISAPPAEVGEEELATGPSEDEEDTEQQDLLNFLNDPYMVGIVDTELLEELEGGSPSPEALDAWQTITQGEYPPVNSLEAVRLAAKLGSKAGLWREALGALGAAQRWRLDVSQEMWDDVLQGCARVWNGRIALALLDELRELQVTTFVQPTLLSIESTLRAVLGAHLGAPPPRNFKKVPFGHAVPGLLEELLTLVNATTDTAAAAALSRTPLAQATELTEQEMREVIVLGGHIGMPEFSKQVFNKMGERFPEQDAAGFGALARAYQFSGQWEQALALLEVAKEKLGEDGVVPVTRAAAVACAQAGRHQEVLSLFSTARTKMNRPDPVLWGAAHLSALESDAVAWVEQLYKETTQELSRNGLPADDPLGGLEAITAVTATCARMSDWESACRLLDFSEERRQALPKKDRLDYWVAASSCFDAAVFATWRCEQPSLALELFFRMREQGLAPNAMSYHIASLELVHSNRSAEARDVYYQATRSAVAKNWLLRPTLIDLSGMDVNLAELIIRLCVEEKTICKVGGSKPFEIRTSSAKDRAKWKMLPDGTEDCPVKRRVCQVLTQRYGFKVSETPGQLALALKEFRKLAGIRKDAVEGKVPKARRKPRSRATHLDAKQNAAQRFLWSGADNEDVEEYR